MMVRFRGGVAPVAETLSGEASGCPVVDIMLNHKPKKETVRRGPPKSSLHPRTPKALDHIRMQARLNGVHPFPRLMVIVEPHLHLQRIAHRVDEETAIDGMHGDALRPVRKDGLGGVDNGPDVAVDADLFP